MMYSPSGVFSSYDIGREVVQHGDGLRFADGADARPAHVHRMESFEDAVAHMCERPSDVQFSAGEVPVKYLRQGFPERQRREVLEEMGLNPGLFADFSAYCSDQHSVTNFHFDQHPGCLQMCAGRKQAILDHDGDSGRDCAPLEHHATAGRLHPGLKESCFCFVYMYGRQCMGDKQWFTHGFISCCLTFRP
ncbi:unnamed protein product [Effrenium voratum]|nr:unnamed protein product [Effrenium voratum]